MVKCNICSEEFYSHTALSEHIFKVHGNKRAVGWGSSASSLAGALIAILILLALPLPARAQVPLPSELTAVFFHDTDRDGMLDTNEAMATGFPLTFGVQHADGTQLSSTAVSDANGHFTATMQPCTCTWTLRANGATYSGVVEVWSQPVQVAVAIQHYELFLPMVAR